MILSSILLVVQLIVNPTALVFTASADHDDATVLDHYDVQIFNVTSTSLLVWTQGIGKPPYDAVRDVLVPFSAFPSFITLTPYSLTVLAVGPTGLNAASLPSQPFEFCPDPSCGVVPPPPPPQDACLTDPLIVTVTQWPSANMGAAPGNRRMLAFGVGNKSWSSFDFHWHTDGHHMLHVIDTRGCDAVVTK